MEFIFTLMGFLTNARGTIAKPAITKKMMEANHARMQAMQSKIQERIKEANSDKLNTTPAQ